MASSPTHSVAPRWEARTWALLAVLCGVLFLDGLDVSMVGMALPSIRDELGLTTSQLQWVVSGYVLGYGGLLLLGGRAADLLGRRRVLLIGLTVFLAASAVGGLLTELGWRWVFLLPVPVALAVLIIARRVIPRDKLIPGQRRRYDVAGAVTITGAMLLLVRT